MELKALLENASQDFLEENKDILDSLKRAKRRGVSTTAPSMSEPERTLETYWRILGGPELEREYVFSEEHGWRLDFYHAETMTGIEIHGAVWSGGRHVRPKGFIGDRKKMNRAQELGITVFELVTPVEFSEVERVYKHVVKELARRRAKEEGYGVDSERAVEKAEATEDCPKTSVGTSGRRHGRATRSRRAGRKGA